MNLVPPTLQSDVLLTALRGQAYFEVVRWTGVMFAFPNYSKYVHMYCIKRMGHYLPKLSQKLRFDLRSTLQDRSRFWGLFSKGKLCFLTE